MEDSEPSSPISKTSSDDSVFEKATGKPRVLGIDSRSSSFDTLIAKRRPEVTGIVESMVRSAAPYERVLVAGELDSDQRPFLS